jgi:Flp pilus assembly protein TadG
MTRSLFSFFKAKRGAALVEFSLVAPMLVFLMCGLAEFASVMRQYHIMEKGVRDAGRYLARVPMTGCTLNGAAVTQAQNLALTGRTGSGSYLLPSWTDSNTVSVTIAQCFNNSSGSYRGRANMPVIEVTANAPYADLGLLSVIGIGDIDLEVSHQQLWIGE